MRGLNLADDTGAISFGGKADEAANTADELGAVATHLDSIDALASHPPNSAMVEGIQDAIASGRPLSPGEQYFITHELTEAEAVASGFSQDAAHAAALDTPRLS